LLFLCAHRPDAERFRAIAEQHQCIGSDARQLVILFGGQKNEIVFFQDAFVAFNVLDRALAVDHQKGLGRLMVMHRCTVARSKMKHPGAKIVGAEELNISQIFFTGLFYLFVQVDELHGFLPDGMCWS